MHGWGNLQGNIKKVGGGGFQKEERTHHPITIRGSMANMRTGWFVVSVAGRGGALI